MNSSDCCVAVMRVALSVATHCLGSFVIHLVHVKQYRVQQES
jgi:hypothetical protein